MSPKSTTLLLSLLLLSSTTFAFNITRLLDNHPDFSTFNDLLTKSGVASAINSRRTVTILVVDNAGMAAIASKPPTTIKNILATHVILDYYDKMKFGDMAGKSSLLTTLFQTSGIAYREQGFLNVTKAHGEVVFGSAMKGAEHNAQMTQVVAAQPYNISVIQVSKPIIAPGIDQTAPVSQSPTPAEAATPPKAPLKKAKSPVEAPSPADTPAADESLAPEADAPATPASSPAPAEGPVADGDAVDDEPKQATAKSAGARVTVAASLTGVVSLIAVLVA